MTNFQFTQAHIHRLEAAGVKWVRTGNVADSAWKINAWLCNSSHDLTPRGLLVGTATDLLEKVVSDHTSVEFDLSHSVSFRPFNARKWYDTHPTQEENLIDLIVDLSAQLKAKEMPPVTLDTLNERLTRIERKFQ